MISSHWLVPCLLDVLFSLAGCTEPDNDDYLVSSEATVGSSNELMLSGRMDC